MGTKTKSGFMLFSILMFVFHGLSCSKQQHEWQGEVLLEDGVKVINNPAEPMFGEIELNLEEDLSIGNEKDDNYLFYRARDIALDSENSIYIVDFRNYRIQKFDEMGRYLQTIGRKGQGPGEFQGPLGIVLDVQDSLYIIEYKKIHIFNSHGEYKRSYPLEHHLVDFAVDSNGNILGYSDLHQRDKARRGIIKMDLTGNIINTFAVYTDLGIKIVIGKNATFTLSPNHVYTPRLMFTSLDSDEYIYGYASQYLINLIDNEGNPLFRIRMTVDPIPISQKEKDYIINRASHSLEQRQIPISRKMVEESMHFDQYRAFYSRILTDEMKRLYIQRVRDVLEKSETFEFDIISRNGYYMYKINFPFSPEIIKNGFLYDIQTDEETGEVLIKRYRIKNWDQLKTGIN